jgi:hypothetical protein
LQALSSQGTTLPVFASVIWGTNFFQPSVRRLAGGLDREGTGTATYLGRYTEHVTMVINLPTLSSTGAATFTAANGDTLFATVAGQATRTSPTTLSIVEVYTITGGTGRFADATGAFTLESTLDQTTGVSTGTLSGVIDH